MSLEWISSIISDRIADSIAFYIYQINNYPSSKLVKEFASRNIEYIDIFKDKLIKFLESKYYINRVDSSILIYDDYVFKNVIAEICLESFEVKCKCDNKENKENEESMKMIEEDLIFFREYVS